MTTPMADTILYGGDIFTMDPGSTGGGASGEHTRVEAVAVANKVILAVGTVETVFQHAGPKTETIFLKNQTLMPGFIEPHQHAIQCALMRSQYVNISAIEYRSFSDINKVMTKTIADIVADPKNKSWAIFFGWDPELISDLPTLSATYLDDNYSSSIQVIVVGQSGHVCWVNHKALDSAGITSGTPSPSGGTIVKDGAGNPTGQLFEEPAIMMVLGKAPMPEPEEVLTSLAAQWRAYASAGLTTVTDMAYMPEPSLNTALKLTSDLPTFPIRLGLYRMTHAVSDGDMKSAAIAQLKQTCCGFSHCVNPKIADKSADLKADEDDGGIGQYSDRLWEVGMKLVADGSPHCGTSAIREPYMNTPLTDTLGFPPAPGYGILNMESGPLYDTVKRITLAGKQVAIHCHGERSNEQVLRVYEQIYADFPTLTNRHRMEHLGLMTPDQIARAGKLNLALSFFVDHLRFYALVYKTDIFGDRVNRWTPLSEATKNGITWTIHQDHPTFPGEASPFSNMKTAITRCTRDDPGTPYGPEYRVSIDEVLKSYTTHAAWQLHLDHKVGSITVGKQADLVVLSENPYDVAKNPFDLERIKVIETFIDGRRNKFATLKTVPNTELNVLDHANNKH